MSRYYIDVRKADNNVVFGMSEPVFGRLVVTIEANPAHTVFEASVAIENVTELGQVQVNAKPKGRQLDITNIVWNNLSDKALRFIQVGSIDVNRIVLRCVSHFHRFGGHNG